jgi:hypothetical protein
MGELIITHTVIQTNYIFCVQGYRKGGLLRKRRRMVALSS